MPLNNMKIHPCHYVLCGFNQTVSEKYTLVSWNQMVEETATWYRQSYQPLHQGRHPDQTKSHSQGNPSDIDPSGSHSQCSPTVSLRAMEPRTRSISNRPSFEAGCLHSESAEICPELTDIHLELVDIHLESVDIRQELIGIHWELAGTHWEHSSPPLTNKRPRR
ncbi:hypothetical protein AJ79_06069 [Helicocarpus griseus UAMH5409]|uniref:Uncharacterized protein n=1 Tax=Helicocarpus griseus UAMH5409 TaxID=1447875 RepID=A0A2B7XGN0_9EURO|nr:hypothetical protein AJ79_06069 [Helicocarpus griseus UAMH5409]